MSSVCGKVLHNWRLCVCSRRFLCGCTASILKAGGCDSPYGIVLGAEEEHMP